MADTIPTHALLVRREWLEHILRGEKTWEIRGSGTARRGPIALIESGSGRIVGIATLTSVAGPLTPKQFLAARHHHRISGARRRQLPYRRTFAWVLAEARQLARPVPYTHPRGAVIWVALSATTRRRLARAIGAA